MVNKKGLNPESEAALDIVKMEKMQEDREKLKLMQSNNVGLKTGRVQAFKAVRILSEYLEWKNIADIVNSKETLVELGFKTVDDYLEHMGIDRSTGYRNLKIVRTLTPEEVQLFGQIGLSRKDLLGYASLPEEQRLQIKEGKVINLEKADREDIRQILEDLVSEKKKKDDELAAQKKASERVQKDLNDKLHAAHREIARLEEKLKTEAEIAELSDEEEEALKLLYTVQLDICKAISAIKKKIPYDSAPPIVLRQLYFLYIFMSLIALDERLALNEYYKDAEAVPWEITEDELPPADIFVANMPLTKEVGEQFKKYMQSRGCK